MVIQLFSQFQTVDGFIYRKCIQSMKNSLPPVGVVPSQVRGERCFHSRVIETFMHVIEIISFPMVANSFSQVLQLTHERDRHIYRQTYGVAGVALNRPPLSTHFLRLAIKIVWSLALLNEQIQNTYVHHALHLIRHIFLLYVTITKIP